MATQPAENPLAKFDAPVLKAMGNTQLDAGAPRAMFMPTNMGEAMELAKLMASSNFVPAHLRGKAGDCLAVVMQAGRWAMDPFAVGNKSYFVNDRIAYEAQLVGAVLNSSGLLDGRLSYDWEGEGNELVCTVSGKLKGDDGVKKRRVPIKNITTRNSPLWKQDPEQQLGYYAGRAWGRLYAPEVLMGVYTPDELATSMGTAGASAEVREIRPLTAEMIEHQAAIDEPNDGTLSGDNPTAGEGRADAETGELFNDDEHPAFAAARNIADEIAAAPDADSLGAMLAGRKVAIDSMPAEARQIVFEARDVKLTALRSAGRGK